jgi:phosphopantothenoylcysteine decarboxylase/phosphopantothenate--cysteine ligase
MGYALARTAFRRGADVILISGPTALDKPAGVRRIDVATALEMYDAVMAHAASASVIIKAAAVADFRCAHQHKEKVKKDNAELIMELEKNPDILKELSSVLDRSRQLLVGFAAESSDIEEEGRKKLHNKNLDLIAVNDISSDQAGFEVDTNQITLIDQHQEIRLPHTSKLATADKIWDYIVNNKLLKAAV